MDRGLEAVKAIDRHIVSTVRSAQGEGAEEYNIADLEQSFKEFGAVPSDVQRLIDHALDSLSEESGPQQSRAENQDPAPQLVDQALCLVVEPARGPEEAGAVRQIVESTDCCPGAMAKDQLVSAKQ
mmetsp:Transcript_43605/g.59554  ORF Transcript_43605/g.59554 Transcript_43605/m.59554 type:complete len:126 (-) Transcript_43605:242-619(-)